MPVPSRKIASRLRAVRDQGIAQAHSLFASRVRFAPAAAGRDRLFTSQRTFWLFLWQVLCGNLSCSEAVQNALVWLAQTEPEKFTQASPNTAAYCKARLRLPGAALAETLEGCATALESPGEGDPLCHGRPVRIVDGTGLSMPDTAENQKRFPQSKRQKPGCGFPTLRLVAVFSMATGAILRTAWDSLAVHERTLFHRLWDMFRPGDIVVADRGFCAFADFWLLLQRGVDCLMRNHQRRSVGQRTLRCLGPGDHLVAWRKTGQCPDWLDRAVWDAMPREMPVRQIDVAVLIPGFRTRQIRLVTTLLDEHLYPAATFAELYRRRWLAELFLRDVKISMGMDTLKCKTPAMVEKEIQMYLIAYNLLRSLMLQAARDHGRAPLRLSLKRTADALRQWAPLIHAARHRPKDAARLTRDLLSCIARLTVPHRPNRTEPRAIKRRRKNYALLNCPRHEYREIAHRNKYTVAGRGQNANGLS